MKPAIALLVALPLVALPLAAHAATTPPANPASRNLAATLPAAALTRVQLGVMVGQVHIQAGATNAVKIHVHATPGRHGHFIFDWTYGPSANTVPASLHLVSRREGGTLYLCLASKRASGCHLDIKAPSAKTKKGGSSKNRTVVFNPFGGQVVVNGNHPGWQSNWTITLPARLALKLDLDVGEADIAGVAGGVHAEIDVGKLDAQLPRGPLSASVDVGSIHAEVDSADYGPVNLSADVGQVTFLVNGTHVTTGYEHDTPGASQKLTGSGTTAYKLDADVGSVKLKLGVKGLPSLPPVTASSPPAASAPAPGSQTETAVPASAPQTASSPATATTAH